MDSAKDRFGDMTCEICRSDRFVDVHHYDCKEGKISPETIILCRRCHRTYHDLGVEWFDDGIIDRAIQMENRRREIVYANLQTPTKPLLLLKREDIRRSDYWNKIHGIKSKPPGQRQTPRTETDSQGVLELGI